MTESAKDRTNAADSLPPMMTLPEVAAAARASLGTVRHWVRTGRLRSYRVGRRRLVRVADLRAMIGLDDPEPRADR